MRKNIICVIKSYTPALGTILDVHQNCDVIGKQGGVDKYRCNCCNWEFLGGTTGAGEWAELPDANEVNYKLCSQNGTLYNWHLRQIKDFHRRYCQQSWNYDINMKPILLAACSEFGFKPNKSNFDKLLDASVLGVIHNDVQQKLNQEKE